jgi:hypothetical protein
MAGIAQLTTLIFKLSSLLGNSNHQAWLDPQQGLVLGVYPSPSYRFDFAAESVEPLEIQPKLKISLLGEAKRVVQKYEIETIDTIYVVGSTTQLLIQGLDILEDYCPGTLAQLSAEKKQSKRPVATSREALYEHPHPISHSAKLKCGFYVATNNKASEARGFLRQAVGLAGLKWGSSFIVRKA